MKKLKTAIILFGALLGFTNVAFAQSQNDINEIKYRRSSLHTMVVESEKFPKKEVVINAFNNAVFPDKYNDHQIGAKSFDPDNYKLSSEEKATVSYKKSVDLSSLLVSAPEIKIDSLADELPLRIQKYLITDKIANKLVAKWFNRQDDGSFDSRLIEDRGLCNASFLETKAAQSSSDGEALLKTAGFELIDNTFVVINKFNFIANEPVARAIRDAAREFNKDDSKDIPAFIVDKVNKTIDKVYEKTKEGFSIWATSYLYKLVWDEATANVFYTELYMDKSTVNPQKKLAFDNSDLFKLEFVGDESASGLVTFSLSQKRTEDQIIELSTRKIIDKVYAKLQKKYDVFKTRTPLHTGEPITAKIGMKEGLEGGEKFEVLEQNQDPKTGVVSYKRVGTIKVDKKLIWDNTVEAGDVTNAENVSSIDRTTFSGGKKFASGMLIKQIK